MRVLAVLFAAAAGCAAPDAISQQKMIASPPAAAALCVTHGTADTSVLVTTEDGAMRAVMPPASSASGDTADVTFTVHGEAVPPVPLADGTIRHQVALKLRAQDGCNVLYVAWRKEPKPWIQVQLKRNPGKKTAAECGAQGYTQGVPTSPPAAVGAFDDGAPHELGAAVAGAVVTVTVDGQVAWVGTVDAAVGDLAGPVGIRSDNLALTAVLRGMTSCAGVVGD